MLANTNWFPISNLIAFEQLFDLNLSGSLSIEQLGQDVVTYTLRPIHAVIGVVTLRAFLQKFPGNFVVSADGKARLLLPILGL